LPLVRAFGARGDVLVVVHQDVGTYNTVLRADGTFAVIDFDFAAPGRPVGWRAHFLMKRAGL